MYPSKSQIDFINYQASWCSCRKFRFYMGSRHTTCLVISNFLSVKKRIAEIENPIKYLKKIQDYFLRILFELATIGF